MSVAVLDLDGFDDYCENTSGFNGINTARFAVVIAAVFLQSSATHDFQLLGRTGNDQAQVRTDTGGTFGRLILRFGSSASQEYFDLPFDLATGDVVIFLITRDAAGLLTVYVNGQQFGQVTNTYTGNMHQCIGCGQSGSRVTNAIRLAYVQSYDDELQTNLLHNYDPAASNGTGSVLYDTAGGVDLTLLNFPTNDDQWAVIGGGEETDVAVDLSAIVYSAYFNALAVLMPADVGLVAVSADYAVDALTLDVAAPSVGLSALACAVLWPQLSVSYADFNIELNPFVTAASFAAAPAFCIADVELNAVNYSVGFAVPEIVVPDFNVELAAQVYSCEFGVVSAYLLAHLRDYSPGELVFLVVANDYQLAQVEFDYQYGVAATPYTFEVLDYEYQ